MIRLTCYGQNEREPTRTDTFLLLPFSCLSVHHSDDIIGRKYDGVNAHILTCLAEIRSGPNRTQFMYLNVHPVC